MKIVLEIGFSFKRELDQGYHWLEIPIETTVYGALEALVERYPQVRGRLFDETGGIRRNVNALINGANVQQRERFDTVLRPDDRLTILPPIGGG